MIQFNLLPNVKVDYLKTKRLKRLIALIAVGVVGVCAVIVVSLFSVVLGAQPSRLSSLDKSIKGIVEDIKSKPDINKILTIQNQLSQIDRLHEEKPVATRVFNLIVKITPKNVSVQNFTIDFANSKIEVTGQSTSFEEMNKFIDTLKFTTVTNTLDTNLPSTKAFSQVVLSSYSLNDKGAGFNVAFNFDKEIFNSAKDTLRVEVPNITSTRSETERPTDLFKVNLTPAEEGENE